MFQPVFWMFSSWLLAAGGITTPTYEELEPVAKVWPAPPEGCHVYHGELAEELRLPFIGKQSARFKFVSILDGGVWASTDWIHVESNWEDTEDGEVLEPTLGLMYAQNHPSLSGEVSVGTGEGNGVAVKVGEQGESVVEEPSGTGEGESPIVDLPAEGEKEDGFSNLSWYERIAMKTALKAAIEKERASLEESGLDVDMLKKDLVRIIDSDDLEEDEFDQLIGQAMQRQLVGKALVEGEGTDFSQILSQVGDGSLEDYQSLSQQVLEASNKGDVSEAALLALGVEAEDAQVAQPPSQSVDEDRPEITVSGFEEGVLLAQEKAAEPPEENQGEDGEMPTMEQIFNVFETDVEMLSVEHTTYEGRAAYESRRLIAFDDPWLSEPRVTGRFVIFDAETMQPRHYLAEIAHPTRLKEANIPGKFKALKVELALDSFGHVQKEVFHMKMRLGPFSIKVDQVIDYQYQGPCE